MKKFTETNNNTNMDDMLNRLSSHTGLSIEELKGVIDKNIITDKTTGPEYMRSVENYFMSTNEMMTLNDFRDTFAETLEATRNKPQSLNTVIKSLENNFNNVDSVTAMSVVKDILISASGKDANKLSKLLSVTEENFDVVKLNESSDFNFDNEQVDYGSLKNLLSKGSKRWQVSNDMESNYQKIMNYIDSKIDKSNLDVVNFDNEFNLKLLNQYISGSVSPLNMNYSANKHLISDIQSFVFDSLLVINVYVNNHSDYMNFVKQSKVTLYNESVQELLKLLYSSLFNSQIVNKHFLSDVKSGKFDGASNYGDSQKLIDELSSTIVNVNPSEIRFASVINLLQFIHSTSFDFNLKIRPLMKVYINNTLEIVKSLEKIRIQSKN